jgi:hypothetical protein
MENSAKSAIFEGFFEIGPKKTALDAFAADANKINAAVTQPKIKS